MVHQLQIVKHIYTILNMFNYLFYVIFICLDMFIHCFICVCLNILLSSKYLFKMYLCIVFIYVY